MGERGRRALMLPTSFRSPTTCDRSMRRWSSVSLSHLDSWWTCSLLILELRMSIVKGFSGRAGA
jgi:hypothetical protein